MEKTKQNSSSSENRSQYSTKNVAIVSVSMPLQRKLRKENGKKSQLNSQISTHHDFIMSRFQKIT